MSMRNLALYAGLSLLVFSRVVTAQQPTPQDGAPAIEDLVFGCRDYDNNTFLSDVMGDTVSRSGTVLKHLQLPCTENVSGAVFEKDRGDPKITQNLNTLLGDARTPLERFQNGFDLYSWLTFVALNSPYRTGADIGTGNEPTVWEKTFFALDQVIGGGENTRRQACIAQNPGQIADLLVTVDEVAFDQPFKTGPLVDQNGEYSLNTIFMNEKMRDFIAFKNGIGLDTYEHQQAFTGAIDFPAGVRGQHASSNTPEKKSDIGAIMIKASWRVLGDAEDRSEFLTVRAYRYIPSNGHCDVKTLGLVGFHVVHKTEHRHQWIWTTFEHVRNVPSLAEVEKGGDLPYKAYFFYSANPALPKCGVAGEHCGPDGKPLDVRNIPPPQPWNPSRPPAQKSQILRAQAISDDTRTINDEAHDYLKRLSTKLGVWRNYQLISTQWPADFGCASEEFVDKVADPNCSPAPELLPNSTLETYIQHDIGTSGGVPQATSSCIGCHNNAVAYQKVDYQKDTCSPGGVGGTACSPASDFTYILEQVCAPMPPMIDPNTGKPIQATCKREPQEEAR